MLSCMNEYPPEHWRTLGRYVKRKRLLIEAKDNMVEWSSKVGRSTRVLQGIERGEPQGTNTVMLVAGGLGVDPEQLMAILETGTVAEQGGEVDEEGISNADILAEIQAMRSDVEQIKRKVGVRSASTRTRVGDRPAHLTATS